MYYVYRKSNNRPVAGPFNTRTGRQAVGFFVTVILHRGYERRKYYGADPEAEAAKTRRQPTEPDDSRQQEIATLFEQHECSCGSYIEIERGVLETRCPVCDGYVVAGNVTNE